jgi:hypothetical protein
MSNANKRWLLFLGSVALAAFAATTVARHRSTAGTALSSAAPQQRRRSVRTVSPDNEGGGGINGEPGGVLAGNVDGASATKTVDAVMAQWRSGILFKDTDAVLAADAVFRQEPERFLEALMKLAETDSDERVRAFSTRVLGKLVDPACAPLLVRLLDDKSPYVRMNAAWALGELAVTPEGRAAAAPALRSLRRLEEREPAKDTREAAALAARRLM